MDDGPVDGGETLDDDGRKALFQELKAAASSPDIKKTFCYSLSFQQSFYKIKYWIWEIR